MATIKKADKIIVMDAGKIVEEGTHKELLKLQNGFYRNLYEVQFMAEEAFNLNPFLRFLVIRPYFQKAQNHHPLNRKLSHFLRKPLNKLHLFFQ